jgi:murein L,D-transpeptidase YcbB/YkuD
MALAPRDLGDRHILVNIPEMRLDVWDHGTTPVSMRVVVGKPDTQTPIFNDKMTYIVFAPVWNVPDDIAQKETLPAMLADPGFLNRMNMEVMDASGNHVDPTTSSSPVRKGIDFASVGHRNALGLVKFMFPNQFNVYLTLRSTRCLRGQPIVQSWLRAAGRTEARRLRAARSTGGLPARI